MTLNAKDVALNTSQTAQDYTALITSADPKRASGTMQ